MSLRTRLLIAIGVIALVALSIADVATYKYLPSFLYQQVDQQLEGSHIPIETRLDSGHPLSCTFAGLGGPGAQGEQGSQPGSPPPSGAFEVLAVEVRNQ